MSPEGLWWAQGLLSGGRTPASPACTPSTGPGPQRGFSTCVCSRTRMSSRPLEVVCWVTQTFAELGEISRLRGFCQEKPPSRDLGGQY